MRTHVALLSVSWLVLTASVEARIGQPLPRDRSTAVDSASAQAAPDACTVAAIGRAHRMLETHREQLNIPGLQVAVMRDGRMIWSEGLGFADLENGAPVTPLTRFRVASLSKLFTATTMLRLAGRGQLDLDAPIQRYVPEFPVKRWPITLRQLAAHASGIRHYATTEEATDLPHADSVRQALRQFADDSLEFEPGTRIGYSSFGYVLISAAIESAAGMPFLDVLEREVTDPLHLRSTGPDHPDRLVPYRATSYVAGAGDGVMRAPAIDPSAKWASGGLLSTAEELVRLAAGLLDSSLLDTPQQQQFFAPYRLRDGREGTTALGWNLWRDAAGRRVVGSDGSLPSTRALLVMYPEQGLIVAINANLGQGIFLNQQEAMAVAEQFIDASCTPDPAAGDTATLAGSWQFPMDFDGQSGLAKLVIYRQRGEYRGSLTVPHQFFGGRQIPIPAFAADGDQWTFAALPGGTWFRFRMHRADATTLTGSWAFGPERGTFDATRSRDR